MTRTATCCCRACAIVVDGDPALNAICHCGDCKRRTGSAFGWSAYFADDRVQPPLGRLGLYGLRGDVAQERWFCANCGSTLFWKSVSFPDHTGIAGGCFADTPLDMPTLTVSNEERCAWVGLPAGWRTEF
ncbi:MAG: GFA family protein [Dongiaceae bacterium]